MPLKNNSDELPLEVLEEERRLAYVAITRAENRLYLWHSNSLTLPGQDTVGLSESPFLSELGINTQSKPTSQADVFAMMGVG